MWMGMRSSSCSSLGFKKIKVEHAQMQVPSGSCFSHRVIIDPELPLPVLSEPAATPD